MRTQLLWFVLVAFLYASVVECGTKQKPVVQTNQGKVSGVLVKSKYGNKYYAFKGIPYAQPPIGPLRFQQPVPAQSWEGVKDGSKDGSMCLQYFEIQKTITGSEDCLFLNVYVPEGFQETPPGKEKAVMVSIHGGGFLTLTGNSKLFPGGKFTEHDVILVSFNYRLNVFGFLSTGDDVLPGNYGMWDQVLALKWVRDNIKAFGGDPNKVTIFGESAGGASVSMHILSKASRDLFHRAIMQSGSAYNPWSIQEDPLFHAKEIASRLECSTDSSSSIRECLQTMNSKKLMEVVFKYAVFPGIFPLYFTPVIEQNKDGKEHFLTEIPKSIIEKGEFNKVPTINGFMENEGAFFVLGGGKNQFEYNEDFYKDHNFGKYTQDLTNHKTGLPQIVSRIKKHYFSSVTDFGDKKQTMKSLYKFYSSSSFDVGITNFTREIVQHDRQENRHYFYLFTYHGKMSLTNLFTPEKLGATHGDDLQYLFDSDIYTKLSSADQIMSKRLVTLWTNFAKTGIPSTNEEVEWKPVSTDSFRYLEIGKDLTMHTSDYESEENKLWSTVIPKIAAGEELGKDEL